MSKLHMPVFQSAVRVDGAENFRAAPTSSQDVVCAVNSKPLSIEDANKAIEQLAKSTVKWKDATHFGVVTIQNMDWAPESAHDLPPSVADGLGMEVSSQFVMMFNQSATARQRRRWAMLTNRGTVLILTGVKPDERPIHSADFHASVQGGMTFHEAESTANKANEARYALARIPRQWTIAVRRADCVDNPNLADQLAEVEAA